MNELAFRTRTEPGLDSPGIAARSVSSPFPRRNQPDSMHTALMDDKTTRQIKMKLHLLGRCALALLFCSCAATSVTKTWKAPDVQGPPGKIAVVALAERPLLRQGFENRFVAQLTKA